MRRLSAPEVARWRMSGTLLWAGDESNPARVLARLAASQGQDFLPGKWALAQRSASVTSNEAVNAAFDRGALLRTHVLRNTWHFVSPDALRMLLTATARRVHQVNGFQYRSYGVDPDTARSALRVIESELAGTALTREEIAALLAAAGIEGSGPRLAHLVMYAELEGMICSGPLKGKQHTYALLDERAPGEYAGSEADAQADLARAYFATRGPATAKDLARWASLTLAQSAAAAAHADLETIEVDARPLLVSRDPSPALTHAEGSRIDLLQAYDEVLMSYSDTRAIGAPRLTPQVPAFFHHVMVDGQLAGHWRYTRDPQGRPDRIEVVTAEVLRGKLQDGIDAAVERFATFVGRPVTWTVRG